MSRALYSLKMYLFREQFKLDKSEIRALRRINKFIVLVYLDAWFAAPAGPSAPRHDLQLLSKLKSYKDSEIRIVAQNKLLRHLDYLSEVNVCLALFDDKVTASTKKEMIRKMQGSTKKKYSKHRKKQIRKVGRLCNFNVENFF